VGISDAVLATLIVFTAQSDSHHADEAQAWLLARSSGPVSLLINAGGLGLAGPLALVLKAVQAPGCRSPAVAGLHHPGPGGDRADSVSLPFRSSCVSVSTSFFFAYQFPVIGRSDVLSALIIVLIAMTFESRCRCLVLHGALIGLRRDQC